MNDRRRINGPGGSGPPVFSETPLAKTNRARKPNELRKIFLQTGLIPSASGSSYLELEAPNASSRSFFPTTSSIKLSCAVHGPKPLPRNANFSPNLQLAASVKFAPFATRLRRGYVRDSTERDLGIHLENALKGAIIPDRWPKSSVDVAITVLEGEDGECGNVNVGVMNVLAGCITVASAALVDARIDVLDLMTGGVSAVLGGSGGSQKTKILDPSSHEHEELRTACVVGYLPSRDEVTEVWTTGGLDAEGFDELIDSAIDAAKAVQTVLKDVVVESTSRKLDIATAAKQQGKARSSGPQDDVVMKT